MSTSPLGTSGKPALQRPFPILRHGGARLAKLLLVFAKQIVSFFLSEQPDFSFQRVKRLPKKC